VSTCWSAHESTFECDTYQGSRPDSTGTLENVE